MFPGKIDGSGRSSGTMNNVIVDGWSLAVRVLSEGNVEHDT